MTDEWAIIKLGLKTGTSSLHGKSVQAPIWCGILHSVYDSLVNESASLYKIYLCFLLCRSRSPSMIPRRMHTLTYCT